MPALCSAACGWCGMCTAAWERDDADDSDSDLFEHFATISRSENDRIQQERAEDDDEQEICPF